MDTLDIFLKKYSYKFPKGYPDMNNEQDILIMEGILNELGINEKMILEKKLEWNDLSSESRKYNRLTIIADKISKGEPFKLENGSKEVLTFDKNEYADLFANQKVNDIKNIGGPGINRFPFFRDSKNNSISIVDAKTESGKRIIPIHENILPKIKNLIDTSTDEYLISGLTFNQFKDRSNAVGKQFGRLKTKHGFDDLHVFHSIRKTVTTILENSGVSENIAADILGHEKPRITYGLYSGGTNLEVKREAINKISFNF
jgi:hypothetical protein